MTRLLKAQKDNIRNRILEHRFKAEILNYVQEHVDFAKKVYETVFDAETRQKMDELPAGWLPSSDYLSGYFGEKYENIVMNGSCIRHEILGMELDTTSFLIWPSRKNVRVLANHSCFKFDARAPISTEYFKLKTKGENLAVQISEAAANITALLKESATVNKLLEIWPEVEPFIGPALAPKKMGEGTALMVQVESLNKALGLPVEQTS